MRQLLLISLLISSLLATSQVFAITINCPTVTATPSTDNKHYTLSFSNEEGTVPWKTDEKKDAILKSSNHSQPIFSPKKIAMITYRNAKCATLYCTYRIANNHRTELTIMSHTNPPLNYCDVIQSEKRFECYEK